jgi:hypothetical protein
MTKKIRYYSFDFDGCLSNEIYASALETTSPEPWDTDVTSGPQQIDQAIINANKGILEQILSTREDSEDHVMIGSNRQDLMSDWGNGSAINAISPGSEIPRFKAIASHLSAQLDKFLLPDLEEGGGLGSEFDKIAGNKYLNPNGSYKPNLKWGDLVKEEGASTFVDDSTKVSLLFAQMQKASMDHPNDEIEFNFHDDLIGIVEGLQGFFKRYPELIPKNVVLNLQGYSGPKPAGEENEQRSGKTYPYGPAKGIDSIKGTGSIPKSEQDWVDFYKHMKAVVISEASKVSPPTPLNLYNPDKLLVKYSSESIPLNKTPKLAQEHILAYLRQMDIDKRLKCPNANGALAKQLIAEHVGHAKAIGRFHLFGVTAKGFKDIKAELAHLKGDHLKREILFDFKNEIDKLVTIDDLDKFEKRNIIEKSHAYQILEKNQGFMPRFRHTETDSVKALKKMVYDKREALGLELSKDRSARF